MNLNKIQENIISAVENIPNLPKIVKPNTSHKPSLGTKYITTRVSVGEPVRIVIGGQQVSRVTGTFALDVWMPVNTGFDSTADDIIKYFNKPENRWVDYSGDWKIEIHTGYRGTDFKNTDNTWFRNTAILRWNLAFPQE